jgi:hypothetical protein
VAYARLFGYALLFQRYRLIYTDGISLHFAGHGEANSQMVRISSNRATPLI